ncbi:MAG: 1-deoxy-D-xylulose-5-phosphate synthase [Candidatus Cryptobacteroides sp.]
MLENINTPEDLRRLDPGQLAGLCAEIRQYIIECCASNPGHLGSSLGAVELIVGLHYVFNTPEDKIVFDVGHQAYAHKILTGRRDAFRKNRMRDGLSGFPKMSESPYDAFGAGHSSTSISAALGYSYAAKVQGLNYKSIALIGDGALTGGLALEGLNNAGASRSDILIILNDNNISIDNNIGGIHNHLLKLTTDPRYLRLKDKIWNSIGEGRFREKMQKVVRGTKSSILGGYHGAFFEALGFRYFGPIDGNDINAVLDALRRLKDIKGPRILHTITKKGKGYAPAENNPVVWHAPGKFDPATGERITGERNADRYQDVFGEVLLDLARRDERIVGITPAMSTGCGMNLLAREIPGRFFDVGIEEEHAVTFSAGLAAGGMRPFCNIYSSFSQRAYDEIIHDVAMQNLPVVLCFDRAGLVGEDGSTHHGCLDLAAYRPVPNAVISAPRNEIELKRLMYTASQYTGGPFIIRYPRGCGEGTDWRNAGYAVLEPGRGECLREGDGRFAVISAGPMASSALKAADDVEKETGVSPAVYDIRYIKPIDRSILEAAAATGNVLTVEDGSLAGGLFGAVAEYMAMSGCKANLRGLGIPDKYIGQDRQASQRSECGLDAAGISGKIIEMMKFAEKSQKILENKN